MISQIEQAKARSGNVLAVATEGDELIPTIADEVFWVPETPWLLSPVVNVIPLQLFAYHIAAQLGLDASINRETWRNLSLWNNCFSSNSQYYKIKLFVVRRSQAFCLLIGHCLRFRIFSNVVS